MENRPEIKRLYWFEFFKSLSQEMINPFLPVFALVLGASNFLLGSMSSLVTLVGLISQLFFMVVVVKTKRKEESLIIATILWSLMWFVIGSSKDPYQLILFLSIQSFFSTLMTISWTEIFVSSVPNYLRGRIVSKINLFNKIGLVIATLVSGIVFNKYGFVPFIFSVSTLFGLIACSTMLCLKCISPRLPRLRIRFRKTRINFKFLRENPKFYKLLKARIVLSFALGLTSVFFTVQLIKHFHATLFDIALITILGSVVRILVFKPWGFLVDFIGRKAVMIATLTFISLYPLVYAFSPSLMLIYVFTILGNMSWAGFDVAHFTYFSETLDKKRVVDFTTSYNFLTQISLVLGKFIGGLIAEFGSLIAVFMLSFLFRVSSSFFYSRLDEKTGPVRMPLRIGFGEVRFSTLEHTVAIYAELFSILMKNFSRRREKIFHTLDLFIEEMRRFLRKLKS
ncbi:MAG: MFS transporter [Candidatus Aenigmarchaeota archaeon]|nr:MFS transporter [Candidatus Aenigmarchaeota archaeon]